VCVCTWIGFWFEFRFGLESAMYIANSGTAMHMASHVYSIVLSFIVKLNYTLVIL